MTIRDNDLNPVSIFITPQKLTDGSMVYDVTVGKSAVMHAASESDAYDIAQGIAKLIDQHTVDLCEIVTVQTQ